MSRQEKAPVPGTGQNRMSQPYQDRADIVIVGNGIAGLTAAVETRRLDPDKRIVIITDQVHPTINTPALKQFAIGKLTKEQLLAYPVGTERAERIHVVTAHVEEIHARSKYVTLSGNRAFGYDSLLIATGSKPQGLSSSLPGYNFDGVLTLHRLQDYLDLRRRLNEVSEAVVVGGGVHAIETVMGLLFCGIDVHWMIRGETFMSHTLDQTSSEMILEGVRKAGATVHLKTELAGVVGRMGTVAGVITNHQEMIPCQMVLSCTGTKAVTALADRCSIPLKHKSGILVDDQLHTNAPNVYAAGDVAAFKNPETGAYETHALWYAAVEQGRIAGAVLTGHNELAQRPFGARWHSTHLGELSMLNVGDPLLKGDDITTLTDTSNGYRRMTIKDNRLIGYLALGSTPPDSLAIKRIIDEGFSIRDIIRPLLKGNIDARQFLSQQRSRTTRSVSSTSGKMPAVRATDSQVQAVRSTDQLAQLPAASERAETPIAARQGGETNRNTDPIIPYVEEVSPFSGNLPAVSAPPVREVEEVSPFSGNLPVISRNPQPVFEEVSPFSGNLPNIVVEEISPFSGNLPTIQKNESAQTTPAFVSSPERPSRGSLWAYSDEASTNKLNNKGATGGLARPGTAPRSSRGLMSYSNQDPERAKKGQ